MRTTLPAGAVTDGRRHDTALASAAGSALGSVPAGTMRAVVQDRYGSADVLELRDIDRPRVGDDDVLVRVHAAGVDPGVWHLMTGLP